MMTEYILLVEDDPQGQQITQALLEHHGFVVDVTATAEEALQQVNSNDYHLAIIDLSLPGLSGWEFLQNFVQYYPDRQMPCVAVTAYHSAKVAQEVMKAGFVAYFPKPFDLEDFAKQVRRLTV